MARDYVLAILAFVVMALAALSSSPVAGQVCTRQTLLLYASSTCEIFNNADNTSPEFNGGLYASQDQSARITLSEGAVVTVTAYHNFSLSDPRNPELNDYWCSALARNAPPSAGQWPNPWQCSWANGMTAGAGSLTQPIEATPGVPIAHWPSIPMGAVALRLGDLTTSSYQSHTVYPDATPYFQAFPVGPTGGEGKSAGSRWRVQWSDWGFLTNTFAVPADKGGKLFACLWGANNIAKYGSIHLQIDVISGTAICSDV